METNFIRQNFKKLVRANIYYVLMVAGAFLAMILVSVIYVRSIVTKQMYELAEQTMETATTAVSETLRSSGMLFSEVVRIVDGRLDSNGDAPDILEVVRQDLEQIHNYYIVENSPIPEFMKIYGYIDGKWLDGSGWDPKVDYDPYHDVSYDATQRVWYIGAVNSAGERFFSEPYEDADSGNMCISFSQTIDSRHGNSGVLAIDLDLSRITSYVQNQEIANNGYGILISDQFTFAAHREIVLVGESMMEVDANDEYESQYEKIYELLDKGESVSNVRFRDYDGVDSVVFCHTLFNGWYIGIITPYSQYMSTATTLTIIITVLGSALALLLSGLLVRANYRSMRSKEESQSKSNFLARMSHEMRTPMNAVIGMAEIAKNTADPEKLHYCIDRISDASKHLLGVINDVLDMSKIEADKLRPDLTDFAVTDMLGQVKTVMTFKLEEKKQELIINTDASVPAAIISDKQRLAQVLTNLLSNANKFTPEGGKLRVDIKAEPADGKYLLHFDVIDNGIGISKENQEKLFRQFEQVDGSISRKYGGTGLGLSISKRICEMLGGSIGVESEPGKGSRFYFTVLAAAGSAAAEASETPEAEGGEGSLAGKHLLIAEDVQINAEILISLLDDTGITADVAENGRVAVEMFTASPEKYDLIFMDIQMPEMDGLEAARLIRASNVPRAKTVPIVAMTANVFKEDIDKCRAAGMNSHTGKPIEIADVLAKIKKYTCTDSFS